MNPLNRIPLPALRAVEAVARLGSLAAAAGELGVTPGAVSQQVIRAEKVLGLQLFERRPAGMVTSARGAAVVAGLERGFAELSAAVARAERAEDALTISVAPVFAARWLIWRLPRFRALHPEIAVRLDASLGLADPNAGEVDICLRNGPGGYRGVTVERLWPQVIFPVCAPEMAARLQRIEDLARVPVIRETAGNFTWADWLGPAGAPEVVPGGEVAGEGPLYSDSMLCLDAAISGEGVFLSFETLAADALAMGRLTAPFRGRFVTANHYWLVTAAGARPTRAMRAFTGWLKAEVAEAGLGRTMPG
ncbi:LysR substrate-binding domain-containing protein [Pseudoroseicyclus sp. CXY001]|uniref:LysR substrate-binding domain-containing protein n=1 Tax=Pseudoroseicyclus sp. CXY001 TaxID=3242492 RepID=UPI0035714918